MKRRKIKERHFPWPREPEGVRVDVSVSLPLEQAAYQGYSREQLDALMLGIAKVIAADSPSGRGATPGEEPTK